MTTDEHDRLEILFLPARWPVSRLAGSLAGRPWQLARHQSARLGRSKHNGKCKRAPAAGKTNFRRSISLFVFIGRSPPNWLY